MLRITQNEAMPVEELSQAAQSYLEPLLSHVPDKRLRVVGVLMVLGILAGQSPLITHMAGGVRDGSRSITDRARRLYRFVWNGRLSYQLLPSGL
jgi:hypothetical protein